MRKYLLVLLALTAGVALAYGEGELPAGATAQPINKLASTATLTLRGDIVKCTYSPKDGTWSPSDILNDPTTQNILNTAAVALQNANDIAAEYNLLLTQFNEHVLDADANFVTIQTDHNSLKKRVDQILSDIDKEVDVHVCPMCESGAEALNISVNPDGSYTEGVIYLENCVKTALSAGNSFVNQGRYIADNRQRIIRLEDWKPSAQSQLNNHDTRISALENASDSDDDGCDCDLSPYATTVWADTQHSLLENKANLIDNEVKKVDDKLNKHLLNCDGGDEEITISTCKLCDETEGRTMGSVLVWDDANKQMTVQEREITDCAIYSIYTDLSILALGKQGLHFTTLIGELTTKVDGFDGRITDVEEEVGTYSSRIGTLETNYDSFTKPSIESLLKKPHFNKVTYGGTAGSIADALEGRSAIGGKIMVLADGSPTNFYTLSIGELTYPECDGLSSNDVENLVKFLLDSYGGGCACTPDEYIKEETDPIWEAEKAGYVTITAFQEAIESLRQEISEMGVRLDAAEFKANEAWGLAKANEGDLSTVYNELELAIERIAELERQANNATGGN